MLTQRAPVLARFTRSDATRLTSPAAASSSLLTAILAADILPRRPSTIGRRRRPRGHRRSRRRSRSRARPSPTRPKTEARAAVPFQYDFTSDKAIAIAAEQANAFIDARRAGSTRPSRPRSSPTSGPRSSRWPSPAWRTRRKPTLEKLDATALGRHAHRGGARPRRHRAHRAARHRGQQRHGRRSPGRMGGDLDEAERMLAAEIIRAARRRELIVQPDAYRSGQGPGRRERPARRGQHRPGRGRGPQRDATDRRRPRGDPGARARPGRTARRRRRLAGWFLLAVLVVDDAARLDLAVPSDALAPRQRPAPDRTAGRRRHARVQGDRRSRAARLLPSDRRDRDAALDPARRVARDDRHGDHRGHGRCR